jgi:hypothetical protein
LSIDQQTVPVDTAISAAPWLGYDGQGVRTILGFVGKSSPSQARAVRTYESAGLGRAEVIDAADRRLEKWHA